MPNVGTLDFTARIDYRKAETSARRFQQQLDKGFSRNGLGRAAKDARDFEKTLGAATNRVVAFGAAAVVFNTLSRSVGAFAESLVEVDKALTEININLNQSAGGLKEFGINLFNVARQTGQTFEEAAKGAKELARQGLGAEETIKRLKDALVLGRISGLGTTEAVEALTAAINSFNKEALTSTEVLAKFAAVDTKFAVSSKDLAEGVSRVGSTAQSAGVDINQLIGLITSLQQTTQLGGANIANGLKTIFTRITASKDTIDALASVGVSIKDVNGNLRGGVAILQDYARARENLGEVERQSLDRTVGSTFQINKLKAALADITKVNGIYAQSTKTAANATDEAIRKNEQLNQTLSSLIQSTATSLKQLVAAVGNQDLAPALRGLLQFIETARKYLSGETGDQLGESLGQGLLRGLTNVLSGPVLAGISVVLFGTFKKIFQTIAAESQALFKINTATQARARIQERILVLTQNATQAEIAQLNAARSVTAQKEALLAIQARLNRELLIGTELQNAFTTRGPLGTTGVSSRLTKGFIGNFANPLASAVGRERAAGVPPSSIYIDKDPRVAHSGNPAGLLVANRRDEPLGGFQGVNRVIASGGNPRTSGSIPNFANEGPILNRAERYRASQEIRGLFSELRKVKPLSDEFNKIGSQISDATTKISKAARENVLGKLAKEFTGALISSKIIMDRGGVANPAAGLPASAFPMTPAQQANYRRNTDVVNAAYRSQSVSGAMLDQPSYQEYRQSRLLSSVQRGAKLSRSQRIASAQREQRVRNGTFGLSFLAPFAAGFVQPGFQSAGISTGGGTTGGRVSGALEGGLSGASLGVFGPQAAAVGIVVGALAGYLSKASQSVAEFGEAIDKGIAVQQNSVDAIGRVIGINGSLSEGGLRPDAVARFNKQRAEALQDVDPEFRSALSRADLSPDQQADIIAKAQEKLARSTRAGDVQKGARGLNDRGFLERAAANPLNSQFSALNRLVKLFGNQFEGVNQARGIGKSLSGLINEGNVGSIDQKLLNRIIGGKSAAGDADKLADIYDKLGAKVEVTSDRQVEFAEALKTAAIGFKELTKFIDDYKAAAQPQGLRVGAFTNPADNAPLQKAAFAGRNPFMFTQTQRGKSQFGFYQELVDAKALDPDRLRDDPAFRRANALNSSDNAQRAILTFVRSAQPGGGEYTDGRSEPNAKVLQAVLTTLSKRKGQQGEQARVLLGISQQAGNTLLNEGIKPLPTVRGGLVEGVKYSTYAGGTNGAGLAEDRASRLSRGADRAAAQEYFNAHVNKGRSGFTVTSPPSLHKLPNNTDYNSLEGDGQTAMTDPAALNANIQLVQQIVTDQKSTVESLQSVVQRAIDIVVTVNGGDPNTIAQLQAAVQAIYNNQAAASGRPIPPSPPSSNKNGVSNNALRLVGAYNQQGISNAALKLVGEIP